MPYTYLSQALAWVRIGSAAAHGAMGSSGSSRARTVQRSAASQSHCYPFQKVVRMGFLCWALITLPRTAVRWAPRSSAHHSWPAAETLLHASAWSPPSSPPSDLTGTIRPLTWDVMIENEPVWRSSVSVHPGKIAPLAHKLAHRGHRACVRMCPTQVQCLFCSYAFIRVSDRFELSRPRALRMPVRANLRHTDLE